MHSDNVSTSAGESRDRKTTKPLMEKRRRARINASLAELKSLLLEVIKREGARHSKMEKADILEMTVKHLRDMQRQSFTAAAANDPTLIDKQKLGYSECTQEVSRYLSNIEGCDVELRTRLLDHLANFVSGLDHSSSPSPPVAPFSATSSPSATPLSLLPGSSSSLTTASDQPQLPPLRTPGINPSSSDVNNNRAIIQPAHPVPPTQVVSGLQVIPAQLQTGEIAFVLPGSSTGSSQVPNYIIPVYTSPSTLPVKPAVSVASGLAKSGSVMTLLPSADMFQTCTLPPSNINILSQPVSPTIRAVSPSSTVTTAMLSRSTGYHSDSDVSKKQEPHSSFNETEIHGSVPQLAGVRHKDGKSTIHYERVSDSTKKRHHDATSSDTGRHFDQRTFFGRHHDMLELGEVRHEREHLGKASPKITGDSGAIYRYDVKDFSESRSHSVGDLREVRHLDTKDISCVRHQTVGLSEERHLSMLGLSDVRHGDATESGALAHGFIGLGEERLQNVRGVTEVRRHDSDSAGFKFLGVKGQHQNVRDLIEVRHRDSDSAGIRFMSVGGQHQNVRDLREVRHREQVRNPSEESQNVAGDSNEERHRDVREIPDARHHDETEQPGNASVWRPW